MRQRVDGVEDDEVVPREQLAQSRVVLRTALEVEVTQDLDLLDRPPARGLRCDAGDPARVGVRSCHLDVHALDHECDR